MLADFGVAAILDESDANNCTQDAKVNNLLFVLIRTPYGPVTKQVQAFEDTLQLSSNYPCNLTFEKIIINVDC